jgi:hypothetical protein
LGEVWVNGVYVGKHEGGEAPFTLDITDAIKPKANNLVAVRVLNPDNQPIDGIVLKETPHRQKLIPFVNGNLYDYGGIEESVELLLTPTVRLEDIFVRPDWRTGRIRVQANVRNASGKAARARLHFAVAPAATGQTVLVTALDREVPVGDTLVEQQLQVEDHHLWDLADPYLYRVTARVQAEGLDGSHEASVRCGFRDFRVVNGYFRLNGKRLFLRSIHTGNMCPFSQILPPEGAPDLLRRDMLYAKASGFNTVRFISGVAHPYQLDLCDEIGLMVYEESLAAWVLGDSPKMKERFDSSIREMVLRDRNHPCVTIWGVLNETEDGPVFRHAVETLKLVRSLDETRLVLLGSGRFDGQLGIGSVSNPGSSEWQHMWGKEASGAPRAGHLFAHMDEDAGFVVELNPDDASSNNGATSDYPLMILTGDVHIYPQVPQTPEVNRLLRTIGEDSKPVFLSEYGIGSLENVIHEARMYEQLGVRPDAEDYVLMRSMADKFTDDWTRFGMDGVYAFPEYMLRDSEFRMARHRLLGFNLIRSNPKICGFNLTGMEGITGEGVWRLSRGWKPGAMDAMQDGWKPLRWCLFAEPTHAYAGRSVKLEAVLANEDVLRPGEYPARFRVCGPRGVAWERQVVVRVPTVQPGEDGPLAIPVMAEEVVVDGPEGDYELTAYIERGAAPAEASWQFHLTDLSSLPQLNQTVTLWGIPGNVKSWLKARGVAGEEFGVATPDRRKVILVGDLSKERSNAEGWKELARRMARGSAVLFLSPEAFNREKDSVGWLPLANKGRCYRFGDWLYHKECVAKEHPVFEGLQGKGILDWYYYGPVIPHFLFDGQDTPREVIAAAFATGYPIPGGYASGVLLGSYQFGEGRFIVNTFPVMENAEGHPAAGRLLLNMIKYAGGFTAKPLAGLPSDFDHQLKVIGYS